MDDVNASLSYLNGRLLRFISKYSGKHYSGLQMAAHGQSMVFTTACRRRIRQVAIAGQVIRHFTEPWADDFLRDVEVQLQKAYPGHAGLVSAICVPRFAAKYGGRMTEFPFDKQAPVFTPGAAYLPQRVSIPELLHDSQRIYDAQLASYHALVGSMNSTIAMLKGKLDNFSSKAFAKIHIKHKQ